MREVFFRAWRLHREHQSLAGVEKLIVDIALQHPEYHSLLSNPERFAERDYAPELGDTNPFLHLAMHVAIMEQLAIDQPRGIVARYQRLLQRLSDEHDAPPGVEKLIVDIALQHPEYHSLLSNPERFAERDYAPELGDTNPFLHLAMHVAIMEQLAIDQPRGIVARYQRLLQRLSDEHDAQHHIMECLGEMLWRAGRDKTAPDEKVYLECLERLEAQTRHQA